MVYYLVFYRFRHDFDKVIQRAIETGKEDQRITFFHRFAEDFDRFFRSSEFAVNVPYDYALLLAFGFELRRAYYHIFRFIVGTSAAAVQLRGQIWQSIFTHDMERFQRALYDRMGDIITLICGPSGSGKELVAQAIGLSRFIPFDGERLRFEEDFIRAFYPLSLSALSPTLIESELFGHRKGAFTGALADRPGYFEVCGSYGTVFLDEIGDTDAEIQIKLLRVLQTRRFQRLGDTEPQVFRGKVMAATNRDLEKDMQAGRFREDFYYRICADRRRHRNHRRANRRTQHRPS